VLRFKVVLIMQNKQPMDENSTQSRIEPKNITTAHTSMPQPNKRTLALIRQFARCYNVSAALPVAINSMILN